MIASSSTDSTEDFGSLGPVGRSATDDRFLHLNIVLGSTPYRVATALRLLMVWTALAPILPVKEVWQIAQSNFAKESCKWASVRRQMI
jgi:hypothetical protein